MSQNVKLHFYRYEIKYLMNKALRQSFESELGFFMGMDPYVKSESGKYFVRSLYFDDDAHSNYYEKIDGIMNRHKFRIRTYTADEAEDCVVFLEMKGKRDNFVFKHRVQLPGDTKRLLLDGSRKLYESVQRHMNESPVLSNFLYEAYRKMLKPAVLVDYNRRPYVSKYAPDFRVTFDDNLNATRTAMLFGGAADRSVMVYPGYCIMEVKFKRHVPAWFHKLVKYYELGRISVSKFCLGVESLGIVHNLE